MILAALELAMGNKLRWRLVVFFAVVHALVLTLVLNFSSAGLCVRERRRGLVDNEWNVEG